MKWNKTARYESKKCKWKEGSEGYMKNCGPGMYCTELWVSQCGRGGYDGGGPGWVGQGRKGLGWVGLDWAGHTGLVAGAAT